MTELQIHEIERFKVVRGDLIQGGTKRLGLQRLLRQVSESKVVCAVDPRGHSGLALAYAAKMYGKQVTLFMAGSEINTYVTAELATMPHVTIRFLPDCQHQRDLAKVVTKYCDRHKAHFVPIGFDYKPFVLAMACEVEQLSITPHEVWVPVGSGTTLKALQRTWPGANFKTVNLGMMPGKDCQFIVGEKPTETARSCPPWRAAPYYDAKLWPFIEQYASPEALIWVVA